MIYVNERILKRLKDDEDYYDLIELPSGRHIPVPIARELVGDKEISKIPLSRKIRDEEFFECPQCGEPSFFKVYQCDYCGYEDEEPEWVSKAKELAFIQLIRQNKHHKLRYIRSI